MILYKKRRHYKYNLHADLEYETGIQLDQKQVDHPKNMGILHIGLTGKLMIKKGYSWDGPSGPTIDTKTFMRGSLIHDALYQLIREGVLPQETRAKADEIIREVCLQDGMSKFRVRYMYQLVRLFGARAARPDLLRAPK